MAAEAPKTWAYTSLVPLATIGELLELIADSHFQVYMRQLCGTLFLLAPLGLLLPVLHPRFRQLRATAFTVTVISLAIEVFQKAISLAIRFPYRILDVDDILLNVAGGVVGWLTWRSKSDRVLCMGRRG